MFFLIFLLALFLRRLDGLGSYREKCEMLYRPALFFLFNVIFFCAVLGMGFIITWCCFLVIKPCDSITSAS